VDDTILRTLEMIHGARLLTMLAALLATGCMKPNPLADESVLAEVRDDGGAHEPGDSEDEPEPGDSDDEPPLADLGGHGCAALEALEPSCTACIADECCTAATLCAEAHDCECLVACTLAGDSPGQCKNTCGPKLDEVPEVAPVLACAQAACASEC
jgi:hypothetical protein